MCDNNNGYPLSVAFVPALCWAFGDQRGTKGESVNTSEYLPCASYVLHILLTVSQNLLTILPSRRCYPRPYMTNSCLSDKKNSNDLIGVLL